MRATARIYGKLSVPARTLELIELITDQGSTVMIDWDSESWGGGVTYAADGSWLGDAHTDSEARADESADVLPQAHDGGQGAARAAT